MLFRKREEKKSHIKISCSLNLYLIYHISCRDGQRQASCSACFAFALASALLSNAIANSSRQRELLHVIAGGTYLSIESRENASWKRKYRMTDRIFTVSISTISFALKFINERLYHPRLSVTTSEHIIF